MNMKKETIIKGMKIGGSLLTAVAIVSEAVFGLKDNPILDIVSKVTNKK